MMDKKKNVKCMDCVYCKDCSNIFQKQNHFICTHENIFKSALEYEKKTGKRIIKQKDFIGFKPIKTSLKYCPLKEVKKDE